MKQPTDRQLEVFAVLCKLHEQQGYPPTLRELGAALGIRHYRQAVTDHMKALERCGFVRQANKHQSRAWLPVRHCKPKTEWRLLLPKFCPRGSTYFGLKCPCCREVN